MQDIGTIPGGQNSFGEAINIKGEIVGYDSDATNADQTFRWTQRTGPQRLPALQGMASVAYGVNASGEIVGAYQGQRFAYFWSPRTGFQDLGGLGGTQVVAMGVSASGQVAGYSATTAGPFHAFSWTQSTGMQDLGTLPGGTYSVATAINDFGQIVGYADNSQGVTLAVSWRNDTIRVLGKLGGRGKSVFSMANVINKIGLVVGTSTVVGGGMHAFLWSASGGMQDLGIPGTDSSALGINAGGEVVGYSAGEAFLWTAVGGVQYLGTLGGNFSTATAINDAEQVTGYSTLPQ
jgi:probable HAF family extracellular repeat protein